MNLLLRSTSAVLTCGEGKAVLGEAVELSRVSPRHRRRSGFTLVEILVVIAIMAILTSILVVSISGIKGSRDLARAASDIQGVLEQARTLAMASGTYTWVGFFEEDPTVAATTPQTAGKGQLVVALVSSKDGSNLSTQLTSGGKLPPSVLNQVVKLVRVPNVHIDTGLGATATATRPTATYEVDPTAASGSGTTPPTFDFPVSTSGTASYNFKQIIQFNPQGDASVILGAPTQYIEIGLRPAHGNLPAANSTDVAAIQITGIGGQVITYRP